MLKDAENRVSYYVDTISLDDFELLKGEKVDLIKLDVEMHEPEIEGMLKIKKDRPTILIEVLSDKIASEIESLIKDLDYSYFSIDEVNPPKKEKSIRKSDHFNFLIPTNKLSLISQIIAQLL